MYDGDIVNCYDGNCLSEDLRSASREDRLTCPACGGLYEYCHGVVVQPYFRHQSKDNCDHYSEPETEEHMVGKKNLYEWICRQDGVSDAVLEAWLPETRQRPDIMFKYNGKPYVIEYQCSPITDEYVCRHGLYKSAGVKDIWILGVQKYLNFTVDGSGNRRRREIEKRNKMHYDPDSDLFMLMFSAEPKGFPIVRPSEYLEDAIESVRAFGYGAFKDKEKMYCAPPAHVGFNGCFTATDTGTSKFERIHKRLWEVVDAATDKMGVAVKHAGLWGSIAWSSVRVLKGGQSGKIIGKLSPSINGDRVTMNIKISYRFTNGIPLWLISLDLGGATWWRGSMNTKIFLAYLDGDMQGALKRVVGKYNSLPSYKGVAQ